MKYTNYSKRAFIENIVYPCQLNKDNIRGYRINYCYLHNELQDLVGFDLYNASPEFIVNCLEEKFFLCTILFKGEKYKGIVFNSFKHDKMENYVVLLTDLKGIADAIEKHYKGYYTGGDTAVEYISINYPEIIKLIRDKKYNSVYNEIKELNKQ